MKLSPELKEAYNFSIKGTVAKITLVMAILSCVRLAIDIHQLPMAKLLEYILKTYKVVFHTCFDVIFFWAPFSISPLAKDILILYFLFGFVRQKVVLIQLQFNYRHPWIILHNYKNSKVRYMLYAVSRALKAATLWPIYLKDAFAHPFLVVAHGAHGPSGLDFQRNRPDVNAQRPSYSYYGDARLMMVIRLVATLTGAAVVLAFNYAFSI